MFISVANILQTEADALKKKLVEKEGNEFEVSELSRRFMSDMEQSEKTEK